MLSFVNSQAKCEYQPLRYTYMQDTYLTIRCKKIKLLLCAFPSYRKEFSFIVHPLLFLSFVQTSFPWCLYVHDSQLNHLSTYRHSPTCSETKYIDIQLWYEWKEQQNLQCYIRTHKTHALYVFYLCILICRTQLNNKRIYSFKKNLSELKVSKRNEKNVFNLKIFYIRQRHGKNPKRANHVMFLSHTFLLFFLVVFATSKSSASPIHEIANDFAGSQYNAFHKRYTRKMYGKSR